MARSNQPQNEKGAGSGMRGDVVVDSQQHAKSVVCSMHLVLYLYCYCGRSDEPNTHIHSCREANT